MSKAKRKGKCQALNINESTLREMHAEVRDICRERGNDRLSEEYSLLCALGACLGNWPRVRRVTVGRLMARVETLRREKGKP